MVGLLDMLVPVDVLPPNHFFKVKQSFIDCTVTEWWSRWIVLQSKL